MALLIATAVSGLSFALLAEALASKKMHDRSASNLRALEAAETGICRAEEEIWSSKDTGSDGVGNLSGAYDGATFKVTATQDPVTATRWVMRATGTHGFGVRRIEVGVNRLPSGV